ncbi:MAG: hemerythrin domain-containing protein [Leptospirales bacterium]
MENIAQLMSEEHKRCDDLFTEVESDVVDKNWEEGSSKYKRFMTSMVAHLASEEEILFPEFEKKTGSSHGPTSVMKMEHEQMRELMTQIQTAFAEKTYDKLAGILETLMMLLQQHNMKEEHMLYPMADEVLGENGPEIAERLKSSIK